MKYKLVQSPFTLKISTAIDLETGDLFPFDDGNRHYQQYLAWLAEGNEPLPPDPPPNESCAINPAPTEGTV